MTQAIKLFNFIFFNNRRFRAIICGLKKFCKIKMKNIKDFQPAEDEMKKIEDLFELINGRTGLKLSYHLMKLSEFGKNTLSQDTESTKKAKTLCGYSVTRTTLPKARIN